MQTKKKLDQIGIITYPMPKAGLIPLSNLIRLIHPLTEKLYVISGISGEGPISFYADLPQNNIRYFFIYTMEYKKTILKIWSFFFDQVKRSYIILANGAKHVDLWIIYSGTSALFLPILTLKLLGKKTFILLLGSEEKQAKSINSALWKRIVFLGKINLSLADQIIIYSPRLITEYKLDKYRNKMIISNEHFIDFSKFYMKIQFNQRENLVTYIGRFSEEKGVMNFANAIAKIDLDILKFRMIGDGILFEKIKHFIEDEKLGDKVELIGWISHDKLPRYLNESRLLVIPSYTEGLPNLMLEAMACGSPVLATPVGAIPDLIIEGNTGFLMENNTPECISKNIIRALSHPELETIIDNAKKRVEKDFSYEATLDKWRDIIQ